MKTKFYKLISALLVLSFLVSMFTVFSFADETSGEGNSGYTLVYNRSYEDGWDYLNGFYSKNSKPNGNNVSIDFEEDSLGNYNYFLRYEVVNANEAVMQLDMPSSNQAVMGDPNKMTVKSSVVEFSFKADDVAKLGKIVWMRNAGNEDKHDSTILSVNAKGELILFPESNSTDTSNLLDAEVLNAGEKGANINLGKLKNEWINIGLVFNWVDSAKDRATRGANYLACDLYLGYGLNAGYESSTPTRLHLRYANDNDFGFDYINIGFPALAQRSDASLNSSIGMGFCLDNCKMYDSATPTVLTFGAEEFGSAVDTLQEKVIEIKSGASALGKSQIIANALIMKVGVDSALIKDKKYSLVGNKNDSEYSGVYGAPVKKDGNVLIPFQLLLDYIGFPSYTHPDGESFDITTGTSTTYLALGRPTASVNGVPIQLSTAPGYAENSAGEKFLAIAIADVPTLLPGWLAIYDDMGFLMIYQDITPDNLDDNEPILTRDNDLDTMIEVMKKFIFETENVSKKADFITNGNKIYESAKTNTNNFSHPYIIANADKFASLKAKYALKNGEAGFDATFKAYVDSVVAEADKFYKDNANITSGKFSSVKEENMPLNEYQTTADSDGYNTATGMLENIVEYTEILPTLAFAYQMTGDENYARFAYAWMSVLATWTHWGPGYFENCAEATAAYAIAYDWLYNAYVSLGLDTTVLAEAIYANGVHEGYKSSVGETCEHVSRQRVGLDAYTTKKTSINAIGNSAMIIAALSVLDYVSGEGAAEGALDEVRYVLANNLQNLTVYGLDIYAPDGSYIESPIKWEKATTLLMKMDMALISAVGTDYGVMNTWGLDTTAYYATNIETADGEIWNYHDGGVSGQEKATINTDIFSYIGSYYNDKNILAIRKNQIENGKKATLIDVLFYTDGITEKPELSLDYHMDGIDAYISRDGWESGSMYTGLMGGDNGVEGSQIDSGNFVYYNKGIEWVMDLGSESDAVIGYANYSDRYKYYRSTAEGQNVVLLKNGGVATVNGSAVDVGQSLNGGGTITDTFVNEHGSYAILDNTRAYGAVTDMARRGMLVTEDRNTVVIQDEITFAKNVKDVAWVMHTQADVTIDSTGRVAYLAARNADNEVYTLRATIVAPRLDYVFTLEQDVSLLSAGLNGSTIDIAAGKTAYSRSGISRLSIQTSSITFNVAVVFEMVTGEDDTAPVGYEYTKMNEWVPAEFGSTSAEVGKTETREEPTAEDIKSGASSATSILKRDTAFSNRLKNLYEALTRVAYAIRKGVSYKASDVAPKYADYLDCREEYDAYLEYVNTRVDVANGIFFTVSGVDPRVKPEDTPTPEE